MRTTHKWLVLLIAVLIVLAGLYTLLFCYVVPKTAAFTIPRKWQLVPLEQPRSIVHGYLGRPSLSDSLTDTWSGGSKGKMYFLRIRYTADTVAVDYSIRYQYSNPLVFKDYLIDSVSIR